MTNLFLIVFISALFWTCNLVAEPIELSFDMLTVKHQEWQTTQSQPIELTAIEGQQVQIRGFIYQLENGQWILAALPNLKSCCLGNTQLSGSQLIVSWDHEPAASNSAVLAQGTFSLDNRTINYRLDKSVIVPKESSWLLPMLLLFTLVGLIGFLFFRNLKKY